MNKKPDSKTLMKAAINIEIALSQMPKKKKSLSEKDAKFRAALGIRLKTGKLAWLPRASVQDTPCKTFACAIWQCAFLVLDYGDWPL